MSKLQEVIVRAEALIKTGTHVLATAREPGPGIVGDDYVDSVLFHEWKPAVLSFIEHVFGLDSVYFKQISKGCEHVYKHDVLRGLGVLKAAKSDLEGGYLVRVRSLAAADLFADFLEMSEHLLDAGYKDPGVLKGS